MVDSATTALQNGACTYQCISNKCTIKTPFSHNSYMKSREFDENYIALFCLEINKLFDNIMLKVVNSEKIGWSEVASTLGMGVW